MNRPTVIHAWKDVEKFYTSLYPREKRAPANQHGTALEAIAEASRRGLPLVWDDPSVIE